MDQHEADTKKQQLEFEAAAAAAAAKEKADNAEKAAEEQAEKIDVVGDDFNMNLLMNDDEMDDISPLI